MQFRIREAAALSCQGKGFLLRVIKKKQSSEDKRSTLLSYKAPPGSKRREKDPRHPLRKGDKNKKKGKGRWLGRQDMHPLLDTSVKGKGGKKYFPL